MMNGIGMATAGRRACGMEKKAFTIIELGLLGLLSPGAYGTYRAIHPYEGMSRGDSFLRGTGHGTVTSIGGIGGVLGGAALADASALALKRPHAFGAPAVLLGGLAGAYGAHRLDNYFRN